MRRVSLAVVVVVVSSLLSTRSLAAQSRPAPDQQAVAAGMILRGAVLDASRAPIVGARVTVVPGPGEPTITTRTDGRGVFTVVVSGGTYTVHVQAPGFTPAAQMIRAVNSSAESQEFVLEIAGRRDTVTVVASAGYGATSNISATKTPTVLRDVPQSVSIVTSQLIKDQMMLSLGDVVRYVPGAAHHQGENNRDEVVLRGNNSSANFFVDGARDDVQYYRDLYNLSRVEILKGPNALIFGRGGAGGVVNRVTKQAEFATFGNVFLGGGSFGSRRLTADLNTGVSSTVAVRLNGVYENSDSFRRAVDLERYGVNPALTWTPSPRTTVNVGYENFHDRRTADRGVTAFRGRPVDVPVDTYFGDPANTHVRARVDLTNATIEHRAGALTVRSHVLFGAYARGYQNFVPREVSASGDHVALTAYNNATTRRNLFHQTDVTYRAATGRVRHTMLAGAEAGRQVTDNFRNTGFFNNETTSILVPLGRPTISVPMTFRQSATDADNHITATVAALYAQDEVAISDRVRLVGGLRLDRFDLTYHDNRAGTTLERVDHLVSPRAGVVFKPATPVSLYGSYSVSYLPSSGDQFSSLTTITQQVEPEKFSNYEAGAKWEPASGLSVTTAVYRLDRTNTRSIDPNDPARIVQTGSQRTNGFEIGVNGGVTSAWTLAGGYAYQKATVTSATTAAAAGAEPGQVPHQTFSLWNRYQVQRRVSVAAGLIYRSDMFATISDRVTLPGYLRADIAAFWTLTGRMRLQLNAENVFNTRYWLNADSDTNISPGSPRAIRVALTVVF